MYEPPVGTPISKLKGAEKFVQIEFEKIVILKEKFVPPWGNKF